MDSKKVMSGLQIDLDSMPDQNTRIIIRHLLNVIETQAKEINQLREEKQKLRDEINHLKGEQGQPKIRKQSSENISSENERKNRDNKQTSKHKKAKKKNLLFIK